MAGTMGIAACLAISRALETCGATHAFGLPGTQNVALFEALRTSTLEIVVPTDEQAAAFMAGAFYRASGRPGVLVTINGPGLAYAIAGLAEAKLDSAALVHILMGRPANSKVGFGLQAIDHAAMLAPVVKAVLRVDRIENVAATIATAFRLATSGEPGPVVVELVDAESAASIQTSPAVVAAPAPPPEASVAAAWRRILAARRPVLLAGQGAAQAAEHFGALADRLGAPVLTTPSARGIVGEDTPLAMGFDVLKGTLDAANALIDAADLVVVVGAKLGHNGSAGFGLKLEPGKTVRVDSSPASLTEVYPAAIALCGDAGDFLAHPLAAEARRSAWTAEELAHWKARISAPAAGNAEPLVAGQPASLFLETLNRVLPPDAIVVTDTGNHQILTRRYLEVRGARGLLSPSDFQSMGFGLPAAIASKLANPERTVIALIGDGSFRMTGFELETAARHGLALPVIVLNDGKLNQIRLQQLREFGRESGVALGALDFQSFAKAVGAAFHSGARSPAAALRMALAERGPTLIEVPVADSRAISVGAAKARAKETARRIVRSPIAARLAAFVGR